MRHLLPTIVTLVMPMTAAGQQVDVEELTLDNGMTFLLLERHEEPNTVSCGWVAKVGSVNERPGITGLSHFFEHLMFKGTTTIGTRDAEAEATLRARLKAAKDELDAITWTEQYDRFFRGEITDPWLAAYDTPRMQELRLEMNELMEQHRALLVNNEFAEIYSTAGATGLNAFTTYDLTFYIVDLPSNKLELWAWMESDRLTDSVFREFYAERDVVHEERRMRLESSPTGRLDEQFDAMFWMASPYAWPVIGWPSDLRSYTLEQARDYFDTYYAPGNLVGVVVGDFDSNALKPLLTEYFGRLPAAPPAPPVVTLEIEQLAEQRMNGACDCPPQVRIAYHAVPFEHADGDALAILAEVLNGPTGRLERTLIEEMEIAVSAGVSLDQRRHAGVFEFRAEARAGTPPEELEAAWDGQVRLAQNDPLTDEELSRIRNRVAADAYRALRSNGALRLQLGIAAARGSWSFINERVERLQGVTPADVMRVARTYLRPENRTVAHYTRSPGSEPLDPALAALSAEAQAQVRTMLERLLSNTDPANVTMILQGMRMQLDMVPDEYRPAYEYVVHRLEAHLEALTAPDRDRSDEEDK